MYDPSIGRFLTQDPLGFAAGDINLYRYVRNSPLNDTDPSGLVSGQLHHGYPLYLGGSSTQPLIDLGSQKAHQAAHNYFSARGFGFGDAGRTAWQALSSWRQQGHIYRSLRAAGVAPQVIRQNLSAMMRGAVPGVSQVRIRGLPGGRIPFAGPACQAVLEIAVNPGPVQAAEVDRSWRNPFRDQNRTGQVELGQRLVIVDVPRFWNLTGISRVASTIEPTEWADYGTMSVSEARLLEGEVDRFASGGLVNVGTPQSGFYREVRVYQVARFNGQYLGE